jgi:hypothetical protein
MIFDLVMNTIAQRPVDEALPPVDTALPKD